MSEEEIQSALRGSPLENFQLGDDGTDAATPTDGEHREEADELPETLDDDHQSDDREQFRERVREEFGGEEVEKEAYLRVYAAIGRRAEAAKIVGVSQSAVAAWLKSDERFKDCFQQAAEMYCERLERVAHRLAVTGVVRKKFTSKGAPVIDFDTKKQYVETEWDSGLLMFLLKANNPTKYREPREVKHSGAVGHQHNHTGEINLNVTVSAVIQELTKSNDYRDFVRSRLPGSNASGVRLDLQSLAVGAGSAPSVN